MLNKCKSLGILHNNLGSWQEEAIAFVSVQVVVQKCFSEPNISV